jgi:hypothetical protein
MAAMEYQLQQAGVALPAISASGPPDPFGLHAPLPPPPALPAPALAMLAAGTPAGAPAAAAPVAAAAAAPAAPAAPAAAAAPPPPPTAFLQVEGMVTADVLVDEQEYREARGPGACRRVFWVL